MKPLFAEQYKVSPANTHGLAVGLGNMFLGRIACRRLRSRTATPVYSICALCGRALTSIVARAGVLPNSKRRWECSFILGIGNFWGGKGITQTTLTSLKPAASEKTLGA